MAEWSKPRDRIEMFQERRDRPALDRDGLSADDKLEM